MRVWWHFEWELSTICILFSRLLFRVQRCFKWITSVHSRVRLFSLKKLYLQQSSSTASLHSSNPPCKRQLLHTKSTQSQIRKEGSHREMLKGKLSDTFTGFRNPVKSVETKAWLTSQMFYPFRPFVQRCLKVIPLRVKTFSLSPALSVSRLHHGSLGWCKTPLHIGERREGERRGEGERKKTLHILWILGCMPKTQNSTCHT